MSQKILRVNLILCGYKFCDHRVASNQHHVEDFFWEGDIAATESR